MNLSEFLLEPNQIPAMPNVIIKALNIIKDDNSGVRELANIISYDQALSTHVLKIVNSAYYGFPQEVISISKALSIMGMSQAKNIILTVAMKSMLTTLGGKELWEHSIKCGVAAEYISGKFKLMSPDEAFMIGFLHDIGKILLNKKSAETYQKVMDFAKRGLDILQAEEIFFKTNHTEVGFFLASQWKLSIIIANAIKYHHDPLKSSMINVASLVYFADKFSQKTFKPPYYDPEIANKTNIHIEDPLLYREEILLKSSVLLSELTT